VQGLVEQFLYSYIYIAWFAVSYVLTLVWLQDLDEMGSQLENFSQLIEKASECSTLAVFGMIVRYHM